jgi:hypothetical protein
MLALLIMLSSSPTIVCRWFWVSFFDLLLIDEKENLHLRHRGQKKSYTNNNAIAVTHMAPDVFIQSESRK